ncbi:MAG TPA: hypothetical protein VLI93_03055 [Acetobacteraceae bacterium]|nr:hypothetical protein [Acetobacteraceae bacterium]
MNHKESTSRITLGITLISAIAAITARYQGIYHRCRTLCDLRALRELCVESDRPTHAATAASIGPFGERDSDFMGGIGLRHKDQEGRKGAKKMPCLTWQFA